MGALRVSVPSVDFGGAYDAPTGINRGGESTITAATRLTMYSNLAPWFHLLTPPAEYDDEAASALALLREHTDADPDPTDTTYQVDDWDRVVFVGQRP